MQNKIAIYTCIFGDYDVLREDNSCQPPDNVDFFIITDNPNITSSFYKLIYKPILFNSAQKTARYYKINSHLIFLNYDWVFFHDGLIKMQLNALNALFNYCVKYDFLTYHHHIRRCTYKEAKVLKTYAFEYSKIINKQVKMLKQNKFPRNLGLHESFFVFRNQKNKNIIELNKLWWEILDNFSMRDQLSLTYTVRKFNISAGYFPGKGRNSPYFTFHSHLKKRKPKYDTMQQYITYKIAQFYYSNFRSIFLRVYEKFMLVFFGKKPFSP